MTIFNSWLMPLLIILSLALFLLLIGSMIRSRQRASRKCTQAITATITDIHIEASNISNGWVVTAQWSSLFLTQPLVFVSPHLSYRPHYRIGDTILIYINPNKPSDYRMQLND